jgi:hypothetical protein
LSFPFTLPLPIIATPKQNLVCIPVLHFLVYIHCSKEFHHDNSWTYLTLTRLNPSITLLPSSFLTAFSAFHYIIFIHRGNVFKYYSLSFFSSPSSPLVFSNSPTNIYLYIHMYI